MLAAVAICAQKAGATVKEGHPPLLIHKCSEKGCYPEEKAVVLDANWRWVHEVGGSTNCYDQGSWNKALCPDVATCAKNCAVEGVDEKSYGANYGVTSSGTELRLQFVVPGGDVGSRLYLLDDEESYLNMNLMNREFAFDVDVSSLPCGLNGALYFVQMDADGGKREFPGNEAGAKYGTGYCDAQCPHDPKFINGEPNIIGWKPVPGVPGSGSGGYGSCCAEMDMYATCMVCDNSNAHVCRRLHSWEANSRATAYTAHACNATRQTRCGGVACGDGDHRYDGLCDKDGCDLQTYRLGERCFYGAGASFAIDTRRPFTVVTQFVTADGTDSGRLDEIRRHYVQDGRTVATPTMSVGGKAFDALSDAYCAAETQAFNSSAAFRARGGMGNMEAAMRKGMTLVFSVWDDYESHMLWLSERGTRGPARQPGPPAWSGD
jgi:cellulose 1,4-beta-cellobiosidase